jgi:hypothetical protein
MTPAEQYRTLMNRLESIAEEWDGSRDGTPGINSDFLDPKRTVRPVWPPQATPTDQQLRQQWADDLHDAVPGVLTWTAAMQWISRTYQIPPTTIADWVAAYRERATVLADPTLDTASQALPYLYVQVKEWLKDQPHAQTPPQTPPRFDPNAHGGEVTPSYRKYFTRDIDRT